MGLPTQDKCDMGKPDEHFLWALLNIGDSIGAPLLVPEPILREWSKHLYLAGFRHCDDEQRDRKSTRLNSSHPTTSRMPSSA